MKHRSTLLAATLSYVDEGHTRSDSSRWSEVCIHLIDGDIPLSEAEQFFSELRARAEVQGNNTLRVRASEIRRAYLFGKSDRERALDLLRKHSYPKAIQQIPPIRSRHSLSEAKVLRSEVVMLMESMSIAQLKRFLALAKVHGAK